MTIEELQQEVRKVYPDAVCYHMSYIREFFFVVYNSVHKRVYKKTAHAAWAAAYQSLKEQNKL